MNLLHDVEAAGAQLCAASQASSLRAASQAWPQMAETCGHILTELLAELTPLAGQLSVQPIHRDAHPANMLFLNGILSGWLDFEIAVRGVRIFDPCYCATSLLSAAWGNLEQRQQWLSLLAALIQGYDGANPLPGVERGAIWHVMLAIEFIFAAFYQRLGDPAGATRNLEMLVWLHGQKDEVLQLTGKA
jgi:Ser/Thr protein kinase RdoA (MazF antagonist)